ELDDILAALVAPPTAPKHVPAPYGKRVRNAPQIARVVDYPALEAGNRSLGLAGEGFAVRFEQARLIAVKKEALAAKVEHVAATRGDGLGYDVLSFDANGRERLIEVKTTSYGPATPFFVTRNELAVSQSEGVRYHLYRLFDFRRAPRLFLKAGQLEQTFALDPVQYLARPRG
ncbi:MAG: DUF3883 domain-containing protein, partial [Gemmatimonadota bacterium]